MPIANVDADSLARISLHDPSNLDIQYSQSRHRLELLRHFNIPAGAHVLELGCGQGDCTVAIADAVGEQGRVVGVDPADLDYGESCVFYYTGWIYFFPNLSDFRITQYEMAYRNSLSHRFSFSCCTI